MKNSINDKQNENNLEVNTEENYGELKVKDNKLMNTIAKILAFFCAVIIWFFAVENESPHYEKTFTNITVDITGIPQGMSVLSGGGNLVDITVKGIRADVNDIKKDDIKIYADASVITTPGKYDLPVNATLANGITVQGFSRDTVSVYISTELQKILPLSAKVTDYSMPPNCTVKTSILGEQTVTVYGPREELDKIAKACVVVSPGNLTSAVNSQGKIKLYDENGEEYSNTYVTQSVHEAVVEVELMTVADIVLTIGSENGYFTSDNTEITIDPPSIRVNGKYEEISGINSLCIYTVDETTVTKDSSFSVDIDDLLSKNGMSLVDGVSSVSVGIKHTGTYVREFSVPYTSVYKIGATSGLSYAPDIMGLKISVRGEKGSEFSSMTSENLSVSVDVSSYTVPGTYMLPVNVEIKGKDGLIYVLGDYSISVTVTQASVPSENMLDG